MNEKEELETKHWADKFAEEIIAKNPNKKKYLVESGITPSGVVHAGNFREVLTQDFVYKALLDKGVKADYQYFWDDYDRFRKVPVGTDKKWEQYLGMPLFKVPDPQECHDNYAEHYEEPIISENNDCGVKCNYLHASKEYPKGIYSDYIKKSLENSEKIKEILNRFREEAREKEWLPIEVYCEKCWKDTTKTEYLGGYKLKYKCNCGHSGEIDFSKKSANVKLRWRIDWPMRWAYYGVDFESSGKDHQASGGSVDTGKPICKEVFNFEPPIQPMYEFIYFKGQKEKMSSSKGNVVKVRQLLEVYEPEIVRYMYTAKINKAFDISFDADLLNTYNYFDEAKKIFYGKSEKKDENESRKYWLSKMTKKYEEQPQFSVCVNTIQITVGDVEKAKKILKKTGHPYKNADERLKTAWKWVNNFAPEQYKFIIQEKMPEIKVDSKVKQVLEMTAEKIDELDGDGLQNFIFNTSKEKGIELKEVFTTFYKLLLNKERGPKLGPFLASLDAEFVKKRLKMIK